MNNAKQNERSRILVADDEAEIRDLLVRYLEREGYDVKLASTGTAALALFGTERFDLAILDVMMPLCDGFEVCRIIRSKSPIPVIMLSARDGESDKVSGLMLGADDYVSKPFSVNELVARVRAILRRSRLDRSPPESSMEVVPAPLEGPGGLAVDTVRHTASKNGAPIQLTPKEFDLLVFLMSSPGRVFTKSRIFSAVWGDFAVEDENTVMVHIRRLRIRIEDDPSSPRLIKTVHGIGYCFAEN